GYIGTSDLVSQKPSSTAVSISYLRQLIEHSPAARVLIFADVCRAPQLGFSNQINTLLADLGKIEKPAVAGILASAPGQISLVDPNLKYGVFGYYLVDSGKHGAADLARLLAAVRSSIASAKKRQDPQRFGKDTAGGLWNLAWGPQFRADSRLLASTR